MAISSFKLQRSLCLSSDVVTYGGISTPRVILCGAEPTTPEKAGTTHEDVTPPVSGTILVSRDVLSLHPLGGVPPAAEPF